jgi:hypothetical protein
MPRTYNKLLSDHPLAVKQRNYYHSRTPEEREHLLELHRSYRAKARETQTEEERIAYNNWQKEYRRNRSETHNDKS